jgi:hypothetical protein
MTGVSRFRLKDYCDPHGFSALAFGQEVELVWKQRWSLVTILYLIVRYIEIPYIVINLLQNLPSISITNEGCEIFFFTRLVIYVVVNAVLGVIIFTRLHAMYWQSKRMFIFLVVIYLAATVACIVLAIIALRHISGEELILSGTYQCIVVFEEGVTLQIAIIWMITTAWETLALCIAVCIAVKHFRELRQTSSGGINIGDYFTVLMETHLIYFASFVVVSCLSLMDSSNSGPETYSGLRQFFLVMQMFVLGPRLILSVRRYHAKLVAEASSMTLIAC